MKKFGDVLAVACFFLIILLSACSGNTQGEKQEKEIPVSVAEVKKTGTSGLQDYVGTIEETNSVILSFEVSGRINRLNVREGQQVTKGQTLATVDRTMLQHSFNMAKSTLGQAEDIYNRFRTLYENNSLPEAKWVEVQTNLQQAKSAESIAKKQLNDCHLIAPFSGLISERFVEDGTNVMPGAPSFRLVKIDDVKVKISIPEKELSTITIGQNATVSITALGRNDIEGKVIEKGVIANPLSHTYEIKIGLANKEKDIMPGMICKVNLENSKTTEQNIVVPNNAVQLDHKGNQFVWLANNNVANRQIIETSGQNNEGVIITKGLRQGDMVIVAGNQKVSENSKIVVR